MSNQPAYTAAGVDIDAMMDVLTSARERIRRTNTRGVVSEIGSFGGLHKSPSARSLLVSSIDGVGTKLQVAHLAAIHHTIGQDLVNHCVNDIVTQGAKPLFFLDYLGTSKLEPGVFSEILEGLCLACEKNKCSLIGGETAEMPGLYPEGKYDLVGTVVGSVKRKNVITGETIREGDAIIGMPSSGLHTNGYSLARKVIFDQAGLTCDDVMPGTSRRVDHILLAIHTSYLLPIQKLIKEVHVRGVAHITGGGLIDNVPRILPDGVYAEVDQGAWTIPSVFKFIAAAGGVPSDEMYRVFNMGIGMVVIVRPREAEMSLKVLRAAGEESRLIGVVRRGNRGVHLVSRPT